MHDASDTMRVLHVAETPVRTVESLGSTGRFHVATASCGEAALRRLAESEADCVVADHPLPDGGAVAFLERVRDEYEHLPFVLFTANGDERVASEAISAGVTDYLRDDPEADQRQVLADCIEEAVTRYRSRRAFPTDRARLSWFVEQSPLGVIEWNEALEIEGVNEAAEAILGYDASELRGLPWDELVPETDHAAAEDVTPQTLLAEDGHHGVHENVTADGRRIVCEWYDDVVTDDAGETVAVFSQFQDITDRKERERTLQQLHEASRDLLAADSKAAVAEIIVAAVRDTLGYDNNAVRFVSDDGRELHPVAMTAGITEVLGDRPVYPVGSGTAGRAFAEDETLLYDDVQTVDDGYERGAARAGMYLPIGTHGTLSINDREPGAFDETDVHLAEMFAANAAVALDKIVQTERLEGQNRRLDEFTRVVSHDLQNPLNVAMGRVELAREECDCEHLDVTARAHERMQTLTENLLSLAREDAPVADVESVSLARAVRDCWQNVQTARATLDVASDRVLTADRSRFQQLLENLVRNAVEHGPDDVTVTVGSIDGGFYVEDDGPGIPADARDRAFQSGYTTDNDGTGFGLSIVDSIVDAHGWHVHVTESASGGTRFEFTDGR